jgi:glutathione synthase/RimK-type ligase-like ATP-grasp enzyme
LHIAFATSTAHADLTADDRLAVAALELRGATVAASIWTDKSIDWAGFDSVILRSTWDYYDRADEFRAWIDRLDAIGARVWNPPPVLRWSMKKTYLRDLENAGVSVVPTIWLSKGDTPDLRTLLVERGWSEAIVKPVISANASRTWRVSTTTASDLDAQLADSLEICDVMVQPFIAEIQTRGEWSMMFIDGRFSHAVRKTPSAGDFRVQASYGGQSIADEPSREVLAAAMAVLDAAPSPWLYARVDGVETASGFVLLELEMLEPSFYFEATTTGAARFADAIIARAVEIR